MKVKPETHEKIKQWKKDNPEKQKIYAKRCYEKSKHKIEELEIQKRIDYIKKLFEKE